MCDRGYIAQRILHNVPLCYVCLYASTTKSGVTFTLFVVVVAVTSCWQCQCSTNSLSIIYLYRDMRAETFTFNNVHLRCMKRTEGSNKIDVVQFTTKTIRIYLSACVCVYVGGGNNTCAANSHNEMRVYEVRHEFCSHSQCTRSINYA